MATDSTSAMERYNPFPMEVWNGLVHVARTYEAGMTGAILVQLNYVNGTLGSWDFQCRQHGNLATTQEMRALIAITVTS